MTSDFPVRLNKYLALASGISRRQADELIQAGRVKINGEPVILGARVEKDDDVQVDSKSVASNTPFVYLAFHKPIHYVCSRKQQGDNPTIYDLIPKNYHALKPVGRLDRDSSGIILLTNDGDFAQQMTHPSFHKIKRYEATLDRPLEPLHQQMIGDFGVNLDDGKSQLTLERQSDDRTEWIVTMSEGRNRQIRRTFSSLGYTVMKLHRTDFGSYHLGNIEEGKLEIVKKI